MRPVLLLLISGALSAAAAAPRAAPLEPSVLPFLADDYPRALAEARAKDIPLFVELSAPWCHTCRSMKAFVFTDEALRDQGPRYVWAEIDTEKARNASLKKKHAIRALPTYLVLDPATEEVLLRWVGGATVSQLERLLDDTRAQFDRARSGRPPGDGPDDLLASADRLYGEGKTAEAAELYERAITTAPEGWPKYARAVEAVLVARSIDETCDAAVELARDAYPRLAATTSVAVVATVGLDCAVALPDTAAAKPEIVAFFEEAARKAAGDRSIPMADDDRSGVYLSLLSARQAASDTSGARAVAGEWSAFLEEAARRAPTPAARAVFDSHRLSAYLELGQPERAVPMLQASERDLPEDYNPPARLALAYKAMGQWDEALAASDRAVARCYGPRLIGLLRTRSDIQLARADTTAARATLEDAVRQAEALPEGQRSETTIGSLRQKLEAITPSAGAAPPRN